MKGHLCQVIDQIDLNLPPGTISKAAKKYGLTGQVEHQVLQQIYQRLQNKQEDALQRINMIPDTDEQQQQPDVEEEPASPTDIREVALTAAAAPGSEHAAEGEATNQV